MIQLLSVERVAALPRLQREILESMCRGAGNYCRRHFAFAQGNDAGKAASIFLQSASRATMYAGLGEKLEKGKVRVSVLLRVYVFVRVRSDQIMLIFGWRGVATLPIHAIPRR